jgi:hypothetical protein
MLKVKSHRGLLMEKVDNYFFGTEGTEREAEGTEALCVLCVNSVFSVSTLCQLCVNSVSLCT